MALPPGRKSLGLDGNFEDNRSGPKFATWRCRNNSFLFFFFFFLFCFSNTGGGADKLMGQGTTLGKIRFLLWKLDSRIPRQFTINVCPEAIPTFVEEWIVKNPLCGTGLGMGA